jgi:hypothetical protein
VRPAEAGDVVEAVVGLLHQPLGTVVHVGFTVEEHKVRSAGSGGRHVVWIGEKTAA